MSAAYGPERFFVDPELRSRRSFVTLQLTGRRDFMLILNYGSGEWSSFPGLRAEEVLCGSWITVQEFFYYSAAYGPERFFVDPELRSRRSFVTLQLTGRRDFMLILNYGSGFFSFPGLRAEEVCIVPELRFRFFFRSPAYGLRRFCADPELRFRSFFITLRLTGRRDFMLILNYGSGFFSVPGLRAEEVFIVPELRFRFFFRSPAYRLRRFLLILNYGSGFFSLLPGLRARETLSSFYVNEALFFNVVWLEFRL